MGIVGFWFCALPIMITDPWSRWVNARGTWVYATARLPCRGRHCRPPGPAVLEPTLAGECACARTVSRVLISNSPPVKGLYKETLCEFMWESYSMTSVSRMLRPVVELMFVQVTKLQSFLLWSSSLTPCIWIPIFRRDKRLHNYDKS